MVSSHSSNSTQPKQFLREKNIPLTQACPNFGKPCSSFLGTLIVMQTERRRMIPFGMFHYSVTPLNFWLVIGMKRAWKQGPGRLFRGSKCWKMLRRRVILANICPVPIYSGIGNTVMQINRSMGLPYKDWGIKFKGNSKQQIIKAAWASYRVELVKHYKPRHLVILGKGASARGNWTGWVGIGNAGYGWWISWLH